MEIIKHGSKTPKKRKSIVVKERKLKGVCPECSCSFTCWASETQTHFYTEKTNSPARIIRDGYNHKVIMPNNEQTRDYKTTTCPNPDCKTKEIHVEPMWIYREITTDGTVIEDNIMDGPLSLLHAGKGLLKVIMGIIALIIYPFAWCICTFIDYKSNKRKIQKIKKPEYRAIPNYPWREEIK